MYLQLANIFKLIELTFCAQQPGKARTFGKL